MSSGRIAKKVGMSRVFLPTGEAIPVTYLKVEDNSVVRMRTTEKDGYSAAVMGVDEKIVRTRKGKPRPLHSTRHTAANCVAATCSP